MDSFHFFKHPATTEKKCNCSMRTIFIDIFDHITIFNYLNIIFNSKVKLSKFTPPRVGPHLMEILMWGAVRAACRSFSLFFPLYFFAGDLQVDNNESLGCAHLIPSGGEEKHHSALGILCLKMVICQLEQILGEQER